MKDRGFTLIEILIAILILSIVLTTVYASYTGTFRFIRSSQEDSEIYGMARSAIARMSKDIGGLIPYNSAYVFKGDSYSLKGKDFMRLSFLSSKHIAFSKGGVDSGVAMIGYEVVEDAENDGFMLIRTDVAGWAEEGVDKVDKQSSPEEILKKGFIICRGLDSVVFKFYDAEGKEYDVWDSVSGAEKQKKQAPTVLMITLNLINKNNKERPYHFMTKIFIPPTGTKA